MAKKVIGFIKLHIPAGKANPAPPVGPALGQHGVNIMEFCKAYNDKTKEKTGELKSEKPIEVLFEGTDTNIFKKVTSYSDELLEEMKVVEESFNFL